MNLNILPNYVMLAVTTEWTGNPALKAAVTRHPLGASLWKEIERAHITLLERSKWRQVIKARLAELIKLVLELDATHDRLARAMHDLLLAIAAATRDAELAAFLSGLHEIMFPHQLRIIQMSYLEEAGAAIDLESRMPPRSLQRLESVPVADQSAADIFRAWIHSGKELGRLTQERVRLEASLSGEGTAVARTQSRKVRTEWIRAVRYFLDGLDFLGLSDATREQLLTPLERGIADAMLRREQGGSDMDEPGTDEPGTDGVAARAAAATLDTDAAPAYDNVIA